MPYVSGFLRVRRLRDHLGRPVDPGWGVDEGEIEGGDESPEHPWRPGYPGRPGHGLPWPGYPGRPGHGLPLPGRPVDPGWGVDEGDVPGLPGIPEQGPVIPGRPGHPLPFPPIPVVGTVPLPEGVELPTHRPHEPGCVCVVVEAKSNKRALGWLQGAEAIPEIPHDPDAAPGQPLPKPPVGGHWVCVDADPMSHVCRDVDGVSVAFAFVFEIAPSFGKPEPKKG